MSENSSVKNRLLSLGGRRFYETVPLPEPFGPLRLRSLTVAEGIAIQNYLFDNKGQRVEGREQYASAKRLSATIVDDDGNLMFGDEDLVALSEWPESITDLLMRTYWRLNSAEYVETLAKNLTPAS